MSKFTLVFVTLVAILATALLGLTHAQSNTGDNIIWARGTYYNDQLSTTASGRIECDAILCQGLRSFTLSYPLSASSGFVAPTSASITISARRTTGGTVPIVQKMDFTLVADQTSFKVDIPAQIEGSNAINFFLTLTWAAEVTPGTAEYTARNELYVNLNVNDSTGAKLMWYQVNYAAGYSLETDISDPDFVPTSRDFSVRTVPFTFTGQPEGSMAYTTAITFTNYYENEVSGLDLVLTGTNYFYANVTHFWENSCTVNGVRIQADLNIGDESDEEKDTRTTQFIHLTIPDSTRPLLSAGNLVTIECGDVLNNLSIIYNPKLSAGFAAGEKPVETLTVYPTYTEIATESQPQSVLLIPMNQADITTRNENPQPLMSSMYVFMDRKLGNNGGSVAVSAAFSVTIATIADYSRPLELSFQVSGLVPDLDKQSTKAQPRMIVSIEPDYSVETTPDGNKPPKTPESLFTPFYILPFDINTGETKTLTLPKGFFSTYSGMAPLSFNGALPKRIISVVIPLSPIKVGSFPVQVEAFVKYREASTQTTTNPLAIAVGAIQNNDAAAQDPKTWSWKSTSIQASKLQFDVHPVNKNSYTSYPDEISAMFPTFGYRYAFPSSKSTTGVNQEVSCQVQREECTTYTSYSNGKWRRRTSCSMKADPSYQYKTSSLSQTRVDMDIRVVNAGYKPDKWRRITCGNSFVVEQKPMVYDFRAVSPQLVGYSADQIESPSKKWDMVKEDKLSPIALHKFSLNGEVVGYSEVYGLKNRLSTLAIVMLCLIPVWLALLAAIIIIPIWIIKKS